MSIKRSPVKAVLKKTDISPVGTKYLNLIATDFSKRQKYNLVEKTGNIISKLAPFEKDYRSFSRNIIDFAQNFYMNNEQRLNYLNQIVRSATQFTPDLRMLQDDNPFNNISCELARIYSSQPKSIVTDNFIISDKIELKKSDRFRKDSGERIVFFPDAQVYASPTLFYSNKDDIVKNLVEFYPSHAAKKSVYLGKIFIIISRSPHPHDDDEKS